MQEVPKPAVFFMRSAELYQQMAIAIHPAIDLDSLANILRAQHLKSDLIHPNREA